MSYQVLARKWRPRKFAELVGQEHVVRALTNALDTGRMHHAYLFTGTRGVGKTTIARIFAKSLNCERGESADPCGECSVCTAVDAGRFVDLLEIDAASNTGVDDVREVIENAQYAPSRGRFKVYLVDEVHMLSKQAFNALLKTLEEPPPHVKFLLATTDPQKLPVTVLSRCLKFNLKRLLPDQISGQMRHILGAEDIAYEDARSASWRVAPTARCATACRCSTRRSPTAAARCKADDVRAMLGSVARGQVLGRAARRWPTGDGEALLVECARIASYSPDFGGVLDDVASVLHRIQLIQLVPGYQPREGRRERCRRAGGAGRAVRAGRRAALLPDRHHRSARPGAGAGCAHRLRDGACCACWRFVRARRAGCRGGAALGAGAGIRAVGVRVQCVAHRSTPAPVRAGARAECDAAAARSAPAPPLAAAAEPAAAPVRVRRSRWMPMACPTGAALIERAGLRGPLGQLAQNAALRERDGQTLVLVLQAAAHASGGGADGQPDGRAHRAGAGRAHSPALRQRLPRRRQAHPGGARGRGARRGAGAGRAGRSRTIPWCRRSSATSARACCRSPSSPLQG